MVSTVTSKGLATFAPLYEGQTSVRIPVLSIPSIDQFHLLISGNTATMSIH